MKRFISIAILSLIMNMQFIEYAQAIPGGAFRNFFKLFKSSGDDIIKKADDAYSGEIIVALIDGEEATLKRLRKKGETIALEPSNSAYETKIYGPDRVQVQGTLVGILRSY